jgi:hypothetical protein
MDPGTYYRAADVAAALRKAADQLDEQASDTILGITDALMAVRSILEADAEPVTDGA